LWLVLWRAYESLRAHAHRNICRLGLGLSDFAVLEVLLHKGPTPVNTIGDLVRLTSGSITAAIDRLESKGLVYRSGHPVDRRTRLVHLSQAGRDLADAAFRDHAEAMEIAAAGLSPEERVEAVNLLKKLGLAAQATLSGTSE
jgi:MarR family 2-MHQ and catechol resistance regulon transcriptional repressor